MRIKSILFIAILAALSGSAKAVRDTIAHHFSTSVFAHAGSWWNPEESWKFKYKDYSAGILSAAFPGAKTILVSFTDAWHLFDMLDLVFLIAASTVMGHLFATEKKTWLCVLSLAILWISVFGTFHILYTYIL